MRLLVLGGTQFIGRHFVEAARTAGHELTLFHRGKTGAGLFSDCEHVLGDRLESLAGLEGRDWDAVIDVCAYVPRAVRMAAEALADQVPFCLQVSTISVYADGSDEIDEDSPLATLEDPTTETVTGETYGGLKALCEEEARRGFSRVAFVRPTYVVGPYDHTDRFAYWIDRVGRGEPVSCPVRPDGSSGPMQTVDGRDLAAFMLALVEQGTTGVFNTVSPSMPFREGLERMVAALGSASEVQGVPEDLPHPLLPPLTGEADRFLSIVGSRAVAAGLRCRPFEDTCRDTAEWWRAQSRRLS